MGQSRDGYVTVPRLSPSSGGGPPPPQAERLALPVQFVYTICVEVSFDPAKSERNAAERGLPFDLAAEFDFETALIGEDDRRNYGETRWLAFGMIGNRLHALCFTPTADGIRVISLRKANAREVKRYEKERAADG
jgi:uncharacterized protein